MKAISKIMMGAGLLFLLSACDGGESGENETLRWGTASLGSNAQVVATAIGDVINNQDLDFNVSVQATGGGVENPRLIHDGQLEIAHANEAYSAMNSEGAFEGEEPIELWTLFSMYSNPVIYLAPKDSSLEAVGDLPGHNVSIGPPGSGTNNMTTALFNAYGILDDINESTLGYNASVDALRDGTVDAIALFTSSGLLSPAMEQLEQTTDYKVLSIDESVLDDVFEEHPDYAAATVDADSLEGLSEDMESLASYSIEYADSSMSDETAYEIVQALYENSGQLAEYSQLAGTMSIETALDGIADGVPVHPGAAKYYQEQEVWSDDLTIGERD